MNSDKRSLTNECIQSENEMPLSSAETEGQTDEVEPDRHEDRDEIHVQRDAQRKGKQETGNANLESNISDVPRNELHTIQSTELQDTSYAQGSKMILKSSRSTDRDQDALQNGTTTKERADDPHVLDPDNELMIKFQKALSELLTKQLTKISDEIVELSYSLRKKGKEREDLGVNLFNLQEEVAHSQRQLSFLRKSLLDLEENRIKLEKELESIRAIHKEESNRVSELKTQEEKLRLEIEVLKGDECELKKWETEYNSELAVSQRIADKTDKQKEERALEKQKQDILLLRLRQAVLSLESRREQLQTQREIKLLQQESLCKTIAEGSADLEALQKEQVRLTRVWNGVVISLQHRERVHNEVQIDLRKAKESFQLMLSEIESYKKTAKFEMQHNEKAMNILNRLESEYDDTVKVNNRNKEVISEMERDYAHTTELIKQTEENLRTALMDGKILSQQSTYQQRELERLTLQKNSLEMEILDRVQDQSKHDKAFQHLIRTIKSFKESNKQQEMLFITMENQIAKTMVEVEKARGTVVLNERVIVDAVKDSENYTKSLEQLEGTVKRFTIMMENKMLVIDQLSKKLDSVLARSGVTEESPQEVRIKAIEIETEEISQECEKKQAFWLRLQSHIVHLTEERQSQLQQLSLLYKQIHILNQRALKIEHETLKHQKGEKNIERMMHALNVTLNKITVGLVNKRDHKETLDKENMVIQTEALNFLKDMERENIEQEEELMSLEENNLTLNQEILHLKRECLAWENKIKIATETKQMNDDDKKADGELSQYKAAIHRMSVRYSQLRKFQENLVKDLEHCIMRREALIDQADAKEKKSYISLSTVSNRIVFERKLENLSNRTKQANAETKSILNQLENELPREISSTNDSLTGAKADLQNVQEVLSNNRRKLDEAQLLKLQKLETIVRLQKKVKFYNNIKEGKHKLYFRTESALEAEMYRQQTMNDDLVNLVRLMQQHFPFLKLQCTRVSNILRRQSV